ELGKAIRGDVRFDAGSRLLCPTDASMYQMEPFGVVIPRDGDDVPAAIEIAAKHKVAILPRGGGTSLTGQTVNHALVLDFSRYMDRVLEVNAEALWARVQPGPVQDNLNHHVRPLGLGFGPDTSTSNRATLGGMLGNNSGGSHSIAYGLTVEHVIELTTVLADGSRAAFGEVTPDEVAAECRVPGLEGQIYREVARIRETYADEIQSRYPAHWRRVSGYNLNELVPAIGRRGGTNGKPFNMARLIVGSEGTFVTVLEAKMRLIRRPKRTAVEVIHYRDIQEALESSQSILETGPYAVELTDKMILDLARNNIEQSQRMAFVQGDPAAIMIVEYAGDTDAEVRAKVETLEARRQRERFGYAAHAAHDAGEQQSIWKLRKAGLGLLLGMKGDKKPIAFVEDTAVHPKHLAEFVPRVRDVFAKHDAVGAYYSHCSVGCLHIRPVINLKTPRGLEQVRAIADEITSLVLEFGGTISSEHGDGRARSPFLERMYGPRLMRAFRELKRAFDPENRMNPGTLPPSECTGKRLYEVMDLCLECKGCKAECPANVDMAKLKYEFLHHYYEAHGLPLRNRLFGRIERLNRLGARLPALVNWASGLAVTRWLLERVVAIDHR